MLKKSLLLSLITFSSSMSYAEGLSLRFSPTGADSNLKSKTVGVKFDNKVKGTVYYLGLDTQVSESIFLDTSLGYGELGNSKEKKFTDRVLKVMSRFIAYKTGEFENIYGTAGLAIHNMSRAGKKFESYGAVVGLGIKNEVIQGFGFCLGATYEKSLSTQSYSVEGIKVENDYSSLELAVSLTYKL